MYFDLLQIDTEYFYVMNHLFDKLKEASLQKMTEDLANPDQPKKNTRKKRKKKKAHVKIENNEELNTESFMKEIV